MLTSARRSSSRRLTGLVLVSALTLAGCSGGSDDPAKTDPTASSDSTAATEEKPYLEVPDGVELTAQGSQLDLGETATVAYEPRQDEVAALEITVTRLEKASFKMFVGWKLSPATKKASPYFVRVKVTNVGDTDLGKRRVPLYAVDGTNTLIESSTFASSFKPCPSASFPKKFGSGDTMKTCLVYLAPDKGELTAASFRPVEEFDPITWTGDITKPKDTQDKKKKKNKKQDGKKQDSKKNKKKG